MTPDNNPFVVKIRQSLVQRLESLERAGLSHLKRMPAIRPAVAAEPARVAARPIPRSLPAGVSPPLKTVSRSETAKKVLPSLEKIEQLARSNDVRCQALAEVARDVAACRRCKELANTRTQTVFGVGNPYSQLVFCGEAPGADEDAQGEPFVGRSGQLVTDIIEKGMKIRREDIYILNILRCRPPGNRAPLPVEAAACREFLDRQLAIIQPKYICCLGAVAAQNLLQTEAPIGHLRGIIHDLGGIKVLCTYHPAYLLRNPPAKKFVWDDIQILMAEMGLKKLPT
jgi:uracil-DNA glycosylase family 4